MENWPIDRASAEYIRPLRTAKDVEIFVADLANQSHGQEFGLGVFGRSNCGKSSFINAMFRNGLAKTSKTPGRTDAIHVFRFHFSDSQQSKSKSKLDQFYVFDTPGFGHASVSQQMRKQWDQLMVSFFKVIPESFLLLHIQDSRLPESSTDKIFAEFMNQNFLKRVVILNKIDKLKKQKEKQVLKNNVKELKQIENVDRCFKCSALDKNSLIDVALFIAKRLTKQ